MTDIIPTTDGLAPLAPKNEVDAILNQFLLEAQVMDSSKERYRKSLKRYFLWVAQEGIKLHDVTLVHLLAYRDFLKNTPTAAGEKLSDMTVDNYLVSVKVFYDWAESRRLIMHNPARALKNRAKESKFHREPLSIDICVKLLEYTKARSKRDYAMINLLARCGLRLIELVRLNWGDIEFRQGIRILRVQGKGRTEKDKWVKLKDKAYAPIEEYIKEREKTTGISVAYGDPIFVAEDTANRGGRLTTTSASRIVRTALRAIGVSDRRYTAHSLRHFAGTTALSEGASLEQVQEMLRHSSSATTQGYVKMAQEKKRLEQRSGEDFIDDKLDA